MSLARLQFLFLCFGLCLLTVNAQAPAASRGIQLLPVTADDCMRRARTALEGEGFTIIDPVGPDHYYGRKQNHTAVIMCSPAPDGKMWANVIVATSGTLEGTVPGAERVRIQQRLYPEDRPPTVTAATTWSTQANELSKDPGMRFTVTCPANGAISGRLWGTDLYTNDSSICTAAVHAGLISVEQGGTVAIETRVGVGSYKGSVRFGVTSQDYGSWSGSFVFLR
jgi:hypothetical protein